MFRSSKGSISISKFRQAARVDNNQAHLVEALRGLDGCSVSLGHDDILVGYKQQTFWFEIKDPKTLKKDGNYKAGTIKPSQQWLLDHWPGHYSIVSSYQEILKEITNVS